MPITRLRAPTHYGRPDWNRIFGSVAEKHPETDVGVLFCGPAILGKSLHKMCTKHTDPDSVRLSISLGKREFLNGFGAHRRSALIEVGRRQLIQSAVDTLGSRYHSYAMVEIDNRLGHAIGFHLNVDNVRRVLS